MQLTPRSRIAELREEAELTQAQLAVLVGVTTNTIQNWESGKSGVDQIVRFIKLCIVLNCELKDLIDGMSDSDVGESKPGSFSIRDLYELRQRWGTDTTAHPTDLNSGQNSEVSTWSK